MKPKELFDYLGHKVHKITCRGPCCGHEKIPAKGESRGKAIWALINRESSEQEKDEHKNDSNSE